MYVMTDAFTGLERKCDEVLSREDVCPARTRLLGPATARGSSGLQRYNAYAARPYREGPMPTYRVSKRNPDATTQAEAPVDAPSPYAAALEIAQRLNVHRGSIIYLLEAGPHAALTIGTEVYVFEVDQPAAPAA